MALIKLAGRRPKSLGVRDGRLSPPPAAPKCVCSHVDEQTDPQHGIAPLAPPAGQTPEQTLAAAAVLLAGWPDVQIVTHSDGYLHAECSTRMLGFVDDLELLAGAAEVHVRSASRLGYSDLGVNRRRVEQLRRALTDAQA